MFDLFVLDAISEGDTDFEYGTCENAQKLLNQFNLEIESIIDHHGVDTVGTAIWYTYGCMSGMIHDVLDESVSSGFSAFYQSMESLYSTGFAKHCEDKFSHSDRGDRFSTACYMMWDMGGLEYLTFNRSPDQIKLVEPLIVLGLSHSHAAVQESFLHCLGHQRDALPDFVDPKLTDFLRRQDLTPEIRDYAIQCQSGMIL